MSSPVMKFYFIAKKENTQKWNTIITVDKIDSDVYEWRCVTYYSYQQEFTKVHLNLEEIYLRVRSMMTLMNNVEGDKYDYIVLNFPGFPVMRFNADTVIDVENILMVVAQVLHNWPTSSWEADDDEEDGEEEESSPNQNVIINAEEEDDDDDMPPLIPLSQNAYSQFCHPDSIECECHSGSSAHPFFEPFPKRHRSQ